MVKIGVFIAGRLNSERLPNKLILPLGDTCLWEIACKKLSELPDKYEKFVLCHDDILISIAEKYDLKVIRRNIETTKVDGPLNFIFKDISLSKSDYLMFLNPCLYNLPVNFIVHSLEKFQEGLEEYSYEYATSVKEFKNWLYDEFHLITKVNKNWSTKDIKGYYQAAHAFHIFPKKKFLKTGNLLADDHSRFIVPDIYCLDVDTKEDYEYARWFYGKNSN